MILVFDVCYVLAVTFIKLSLAFMLIRIQKERVWRRAISCLIAVVVMEGLAAFLVDMLRCHPHRAEWDFTYPRSDCKSFDWLKNWLFIASSMSSSRPSLYVLTDYLRLVSVH
jgi:hypothetical protein